MNRLYGCKQCPRECELVAGNADGDHTLPECCPFGFDDPSYYMPFWHLRKAQVSRREPRPTNGCDRR